MFKHRTRDLVLGFRHKEKIYPAATSSQGRHPKTFTEAVIVPLANSACRASKGCVGVGGLPYCMNQPWLTTSDWPVYTLDDAAAKNRTASATSSVVVNSPSTVSFNMTLRT